VTRVVRRRLINVLREETALGKPSALIACVPGDFHEIGPLTAAVLLRGIGWHRIYLGPNVSFEMVKMTLRRKRAQLIILACIMEPSKETLRSWLEAMTQHLQPSCRVFVGGPGFAPYAHLLSTHNISYFNHIQDVKAYPLRTHILNRARAGSQSSYTLW
jgi:cobalamin-dependent methionine synthase I